MCAKSLRLATMIFSVLVLQHLYIDECIFFFTPQDGHLSSQCEVRWTPKSDQSLSRWFGNLSSLAPFPGELAYGPSYGSISIFCIRVLQKQRHYSIYLLYDLLTGEPFDFLKTGKGLRRFGEQISHKRICTKKELMSINAAEKKLGMLSELEKSCYTEKKYHAYTSPEENS